MRLLIPFLLLLASARAAEQGQLDASETLFHVLAAINAAGYDAEINSPNNHPLRHELRKHLASLSIPVLDDLRRFYRDHKKDSEGRTLAQYISYALCVDGPPKFKFRIRQNELPPDVVAMEGFSELLEKFHQQAGLAQIWRASQPAFEQVIERYHAPVTRAVLEANGYLRNPTSGVVGQRFQIYLDLLAGPNQVHTRAFGNEFFVVVTPSPEPQVEEIRHAYLQYLVDPLMLRNKETLEKKKGLLDFAQPAPLLAPDYKTDFALLAQKSLVRAIEARLITGPGAADKRQKWIGQALAEGYILAPYFFEALPAYEKQEQAMRYFLPEMLADIDLKKEDRRLQGVQFAEKPFVRSVKTAPPPPAPPVTGIEKTLADAEELYKQRKLEDARRLFLETLNKTDDKAHHATAYFGLARIATLEKNPELAERLFQKVLGLTPDGFVKGWTLVYLGMLSDAAAERPQAVDFYRRALEVDGASEMAREAARKGMAAPAARTPY